MKVAVTAGFDGASHVLALCELLRRREVGVCGVLVVSPFTWRRLRKLVRSRGLGFLGKAVRRLLGLRRDEKHDSPVAQFLKENTISGKSLQRWCVTHGAAYHKVKSLNEANACAVIAEKNPDCILYGGGGILKGDFIRAAGGRILNAHSGPLPHIRGMNACEWSLLLGLSPTVTIHFIDVGIDTGSQVRAIPIRVEPRDTVEILREKCTVAGVQGLLDCLDRLEEPLPDHKSIGLSRQCYVMAPAIKQILEQRLDRGEFVEQV